MSDSILTTTKQALGLAEDYVAFDPDIIMHINSTFSTLNQLGIGPDLGFQIVDSAATWTNFLGDDPRMNMAKSYTYLCVRLLFDPPIGYVLASMEKVKSEYEWRLNVHREEITYPPEPEVIVQEEPIW